MNAKLIAVSVAVLAAVAVAMVFFPDSANITGFVTAGLGLQNCTDEVKLYTITDYRTAEYRYEVLWNRLDASGSGALATVALRNDEDASGNFGVNYIFGDSVKKSEKAVDAHGEASFEFFHDNLEEALDGNFEVIPPSKTSEVERVLGRTVRTCA